MSERCATVQIRADNEQGFVVINLCDLDPEKHQVYEPAPKPPKVPKAPKPPKVPKVPKAPDAPTAPEAPPAPNE